MKTNMKVIGYIAAAIGVVSIVATFMIKPQLQWEVLDDWPDEIYGFWCAVNVNDDKTEWTYIKDRRDYPGDGRCDWRRDPDLRANARERMFGQRTFLAHSVTYPHPDMHFNERCDINSLKRVVDPKTNERFYRVAWRCGPHEPPWSVPSTVPAEDWWLTVKYGQLYMWHVKT
jgi:hypothetical protein